MTAKESLIRDELATNLGVLDDRFRLIRKEFPLPNAQGAGGFIDILAKDELNHKVIIEIKRSDQAARAALHELTKYVALLKSELGVPSTQLRAVLVSTDWHELRVPFSEYLRVCEVPVEGYEIKVDSSGSVTSAEKFVPLPLEEAVEISDQQFIYFFRNRAARDVVIDQINKDRSAHENCNFVILRGDYGGSRPIVYAHAIYIAFSPCAALDHQDVQVNELFDDEEDEEDEDEARTRRDSDQLDRLIDLLPSTRDDAEIGMPEKLKTMVSSGWHMEVAYRSGKFRTNTLIMTDDDLLQDAQKTSGGAHYYLFSTASPRYAPSWKKMREDCQRALNGNASWVAMIERVLNKVEETEDQATVSLRIYCPCNIVVSLVNLYQNKLDYLPVFDLIVSTGNISRTYVGGMSWDGLPVSTSAEAWITQSYGSVMQFMAKHHFHALGDDEERACGFLGLKYVMILLDATGKTDLDLFIDAEGRSVPRGQISFRSIIDFMKSNSKFGQQLISLIGSISYGLLD